MKRYCKHDRKEWTWKFFKKWKCRFMPSCRLIDGDSRTDRGCLDNNLMRRTCQRLAPSERMVE